LKDSERTKISLIKKKSTGEIFIKRIAKNIDISYLYGKLKGITHKNLPTINHVIYYEPDTYVIEEYINGDSIADIIKKCGKIEEKQAITISLQLCEALSMIHNQVPPIIHRDIKPQNILLKKDGSIKLIDFDIARVFELEKEKDTKYLGTQEYASPEHYGYAQTDVRSDIYSFGVLLHEMTTGQVLNNQKTICDSRLRGIIEKCIKLDPKDRYQSIDEIRKDLLKDSQENIKRHIGIKIGIAFGICIVLFCSLIVWKIKSADNTQFPINLEKFYEQGNYPWDLYDDIYLQEKLEEVMGIQYLTFQECFQQISDFVIYNPEKETYFMSGGVQGLYTIMEAAICVHQNGNIECAYINNGKTYYFTDNEECYADISSDLLYWILSFPDNQLVFQTEVSGKIEDTYKNIDMKSVISITKKDEDYYIEGNASYGINVGNIEGKIEKKDYNTWIYEDGENNLQLVQVNNTLIVYENGSFGGMGVTFMGQYKK